MTLNFDPIIPEWPYQSRTPHRRTCTTPINASTSARSSRVSIDYDRGGSADYGGGSLESHRGDTPSLKTTVSMDSIYTDAFDVNKKDNIFRALSSSDIKRRPRFSTSDLIQNRRHSIGVNSDYPNGELNESDPGSQHNNH